MASANANPAMTSARDRLRNDFLELSGWGEAIAKPMTGDASTRSYERLERGRERAVLMNAPPAAEGAACSPQASETERQRLGYNAMARLAGPNLNAFTAVAGALRDAGLSAPDIFAADAEHGFALIEDLGDDLYAKAIPAGAPEIELYESAIDALITLRSGAPTPPASGQYTMLAYDRLAMEAEVSLLIDWYWPFRKGEKPADDQRAEYLGGWRAALESLPPPSLIVLRDYHAENLLWLPERKATDRVGVIDFQDGLVGNPAYDLVSLLEDARRDVAPELSTAMIARYSERAKAFTDFDEASFRRDYAILGAQRNAKILGIFARLIMRDGKKRYEQFFPRVEAHFRGDLVHPELKTVAAFMRANFGDLF